MAARLTRPATIHSVGPIGTKMSAHGMEIPLFRCYLMKMRVMTRIFPLLLIAVALTLPAAAQTGVRADVRIDAFATLVRPAVLSNAMRTAMPCRSCKVKACSANAVACSSYCVAANALLPNIIGLVPNPSQVVVSSVTPAILGHRGPPDPYPPRPTAIS